MLLFCYFVADNTELKTANLCRNKRRSSVFRGFMCGYGNYLYILPRHVYVLDSEVDKNWGVPYGPPLFLLSHEMLLGYYATEQLVLSFV